jgi:hypothetical protein
VPRAWLRVRAAVTCAGSSTTTPVTASERRLSWTRARPQARKPRSSVRAQAPRWRSCGRRRRSSQTPTSTSSSGGRWSLSGCLRCSASSLPAPATRAMTECESSQTWIGSCRLGRRARRSSSSNCSWTASSRSSTPRCCAHIDAAPSTTAPSTACSAFILNGRDTEMSRRSALSLAIRTHGSSAARLTRPCSPNSRRCSPPRQCRGRA